MKIYKYTIKIFKDDDDEIPKYILGSDTEIDSSIYVNEFNCREEIYVDENLIETIIHKLC